MREPSDTDLDQLFTRNPKTFIRMVLANVLMAKPDKQAEAQRNQIAIFEKWMEFYAKDFTQRYLQADRKVQDALKHGELVGLQSVPINRFGFVKFKELNKRIEELKADETAN